AEAEVGPVAEFHAALAQVDGLDVEGLELAEEPAVAVGVGEVGRLPDVVEGGEVGEVGLPEAGVVADELGEGDLEGVGLGAESVEDGFALDAAGVGFEAGERGGGGLPLEGGEEAAAAGGEEVGAEKGLAE